MKDIEFFIPSDKFIKEFINSFNRIELNELANDLIREGLQGNTDKIINIVREALIKKGSEYFNESLESLAKQKKKSKKTKKNKSKKMRRSTF